MTEDMEVQEQEQEVTENSESQASASIEEVSAPALAANAPPQLDYRALYIDSVAARARAEQEAEILKSQRMSPAVASDDDDITEADFESGKFSQFEAMRRLMRKELKGSLSDLGELSTEFKRGKQISSAENAFFQQYPHLQSAREQLAPMVQQQLANSSNVNPTEYARTAFATIGFYTAMNNPAPQNPPPTPASVPPRQSVPTGRVGSPPASSASVKKLTEVERNAIRSAGYDPNKPESVKEFFDIINNDEPYTP